MFVTVIKLLYSVVAVCFQIVAVTVIEHGVRGSCSFRRLSWKLRFEKTEPVEDKRREDERDDENRQKPDDRAATQPASAPAPFPAWLIELLTVKLAFIVSLIDFT